MHMMYAVLVQPHSMHYAWQEVSICRPLFLPPSEIMCTYRAVLTQMALIDTSGPFPGFPGLCIFSLL